MNPPGTPKPPRRRQQPPQPGTGNHPAGPPPSPGRLRARLSERGVHLDAPDTPENRRLAVKFLVGFVVVAAIAALPATITALSSHGDSSSTKAAPSPTSVPSAQRPSPSPSPDARTSLPAPPVVTSDPPTTAAIVPPAKPRSVSLRIARVKDGYQLVDLDAPATKPVSMLVTADDWDAMTPKERTAAEIVVHDVGAPTVIFGNLAAALPPGAEVTEQTCREAARTGSIKEFTNDTGHKEATRSMGIRTGATLCMMTSSGAVTSAKITDFSYPDYIYGVLSLEVTTWPATAV